MRPSGIQLDLVPKLGIKILFYVQQIFLVYVLSHKLVNECAVEVIVLLLCDGPEFGVDGQRL